MAYNKIFEVRFMGREKSIDRYIKEYYVRFKERKCEDNDKLDDVNSYTEKIVHCYLNKNEEIVSEITDILKINTAEIFNMIIEDAWYHIYENIYFLDIRYNLDQDIDKIKKNSDLGLDKQNAAIDVISLTNYLKEKGYDNERKRRFRYKLKQSWDYENYNYKLFNFPRLSGVFTDYFLIDNECEKNGKKKEEIYFIKSYSDIIDFVFRDKITKNSIAEKMRKYLIWEMDFDWLPVISNLYDSIKNGKNNIFEFQLVERLFKFRTFLEIYDKFIKTKHLDQMLFYLHPFTSFGYSRCMLFLMDKYEILFTKEKDENFAEFFFNAIAYTIDKVVLKVLTTIWKKRTNAEKQNFIRKLKNNCKSIEETHSNMLEYFKYNYDISHLKNNKLAKIKSLYKPILFNTNFIDINYKAAYSLGEDDTNESGAFSDCIVINSFFDSINVLPNTENDDILEMKDYNFEFSDLLYLVTECEYNKYYSEITDED